MQDRENELLTYFINNILYFDFPYYCTAGTLQWSIDENFRFKPCVLMPNERQLTISFNEWKDYVCSTRILHWGDYIRDICDYCAMNHQELSDYCERLVVR